MTFRRVDEETAARYFAWIDNLRPLIEQRTSNTFRRIAEPRPGFIDARRGDGCVPLITTLGAVS